MPTRIRLQRQGKKGRPFYHVVIADGRAPRDGKFIERIGTYNPLCNPVDLKIDSDRALYWLQVGAQPTDTVRNLLSSQGILLKNHLLIGVKKGAITQAQADAKFDVWYNEKLNKLAQVKKEIENLEREDRKSKIAIEKKLNDARAEAIAKKLADEAASKKAKQELEEAATVAEEEKNNTVEEPVSENIDGVEENATVNVEENVTANVEENATANE